jgi:hypothetical protein
LEEISHTEELGLKFRQYGFVSKSGFLDNFDHDSYQLITLPEMYALKNLH